ncbi:MAG: YceI family protein [Isosphaeraceae bacterium]|nr:YceI family protein [Isosphaeraceae bacterium]
MTTRYTFAAGRSRFTVQAFATGMLSFLGHSPTFTVREYSGTLRFDPANLQSTALDLTVSAPSLTLLDQVSAADRAEVERRMFHEVLETPVFPTITFRADDVNAQPRGTGRFRLDIGGRLTLHGVTQPYRIDAELVLGGSDVHLRGEDILSMADFRIKPVSAVGGTIKLKDEVKISFDLLGLPEAT